MDQPRHGNPMQNQGNGWSAPSPMNSGHPRGGMGYGGRGGGGRSGGYMGGPQRGGPRGRGGYGGGPPRGFQGGGRGGFGGDRGGFGGGRGYGGRGGGGGFGGPPGRGFRGRGRGRPAPTNIVKKRKAYQGAQPKKPVALPSKQLFIRPIDTDTKVADVRDFFKVFGDLRDVYLPKDYYTKESKGVAYVEYKEQEDAEEAQAAMDGCEFNGKNISVTFAQSDRKSKETMANGTYAMNMEIEMLKKELFSEGDRLRRIQIGEKVSPPRRDRSRSPRRSRSRDRSRRKFGGDKKDDRFGDRRERRGGDRDDRRENRYDKRGGRQDFRGGDRRDDRRGDRRPRENDFRQRPRGDDNEFRMRPRDDNEFRKRPRDDDNELGGRSRDDDTRRHHGSGSRGRSESGPTWRADAERSRSDNRDRSRDEKPARESYRSDRRDDKSDKIRDEKREDRRDDRRDDKNDSRRDDRRDTESSSFFRSEGRDEHRRRTDRRDDREGGSYHQPDGRDKDRREEKGREKSEYDRSESPKIVPKRERNTNEYGNSHRADERASSDRPERDGNRGHVHKESPGNNRVGLYFNDSSSDSREYSRNDRERSYHPSEHSDGKNESMEPPPSFYHHYDSPGKSQSSVKRERPDDGYRFEVIDDIRGNSNAQSSEKQMDNTST